MSSARSATTISVTEGQIRNLRMVWIRIGAPSSSMNCLRLVPDFSRPMRVPNPAAGRMTETFMREPPIVARLTGSARGGSRGMLPCRTLLIVNGVHAIVKAAENHLSRGGLQNASHSDVDGFRNHLARIIHDDHGAVVQIGDTLVVLLAFFQDENAHRLARKHHRLQSVR